MEKLLLVATKEYQIMKDLKHPNVVRVVDFFQDKTRNTIYMVMELLQG